MWFNRLRGSGINAQYTIYLVRDEGRAELSYQTTGAEPSHKVGPTLPYEEVHVQLSATTASGEGPRSEAWHAQAGEGSKWIVSSYLPIQLRFATHCYFSFVFSCLGGCGGPSARTISTIAVDFFLYEIKNYIPSGATTCMVSLVPKAMVTVRAWSNCMLCASRAFQTLLI